MDQWTCNRPTYFWLTIYGPQTGLFDKQKTDRNWPMTDDKLNMSLPANTIMASLTNCFQWTRLITSSTDKHYLIDSEDEFRLGCRNVSHQQQFFSELPSPGRLHNTNYWYSWVETIYYESRLHSEFKNYVQIEKNKPRLCLVNFNLQMRNLIN